MEKLLLQMTNDLDKNIKLINKEDCVLYDGKTFLHLLVDEKYNEENCFLAIKSLLHAGINVNKKDDFGYNFIQTALYTGYSEKFILDIINESVKYNLNVNHIDNDKDTIMHTVIYSDDYYGDFMNIYNLLCKNGFNSSLLDKSGLNIYQAMVQENKFSKLQIEKLKNKFEQETNSKAAEYDQNLAKLLKKYGSLDYKDDENQTLLHILVDSKMDEASCFTYIQSLLKAGLNVNAKSEFGYNFIQTALYTGYSEKFILNIIHESLKYNLNVNHVDDDKDTIMHTAIYSDDYKGEITNIYNLLCNNGFDSLKEDKDGRNLVEAMIYQKYPSTKVKDFKKIFVQQVKPENNEKKTSKFKILRRK